jgi:hypothetical protein
VIRVPVLLVLICDSIFGIALIITGQADLTLPGCATPRGDFGQFALALDRERLGIAFPD